MYSIISQVITYDIGVGPHRAVSDNNNLLESHQRVKVIISVGEERIGVNPNLALTINNICQTLVFSFFQFLKLCK